MASAMRYEFHLFGPRKGRNIRINGHMFERGVCAMVQSPDKMATCMRVLSYYGAYARGTQEFDDATAKETANGNSVDAQPEAHGRKGNEVSGGSVEAGNRSPQEAAGNRSGSDGPDEGRSRPDPAGDGHAHSGVPAFEDAAGFTRPSEPASDVDAEVAIALRKLDPEVDDHWTKAGIPALAAVELAIGKAGVTRKDVESALPGWDRDEAMKATL